MCVGCHDGWFVSRLWTRRACAHAWRVDSVCFLALTAARDGRATEDGCAIESCGRRFVGGSAATRTASIQGLPVKLIDAQTTDMIQRSAGDAAPYAGVTREAKNMFTLGDPRFVRPDLRRGR